MSNQRARISILSELLAFPTISGKDWTSGTGRSNPAAGDLVSLCSAPDTKWCLSWCREVVVTENGWQKFLLESLEDGELCWWTNVGVNVYSRERVSERPTWQWDDRQFAFNDRWNRVCYKEHDAYIVLPTLPEFKDTGAVILGVRIRHQFSDFRYSQEFPNWKKVTMKIMGEFYVGCCQRYKDSKPDKAA